MSAQDSTTTGNAHQKPRTVAIRFISPSFTQGNRYSIPNVPLSSTVAELRTRLAETIPDLPFSAAHRLYFGGRRINDNVTVADALGVMQENQSGHYTFHVVPPPAHSVPNPSSSVSAAMNAPQYGGTSGTTVGDPTHDLFAQELAHARGNNQTAGLNANVLRRIENIRDHLARNPLNRELDPRRTLPNPAWQDANMFHPAQAQQSVNHSSSHSGHSCLPPTSSSNPRLAGGPGRLEPMNLMQQYIALLPQIEALEREFPTGPVHRTASLLVVQHQFQILADEWTGTPENVPRPDDRQMTSLSSRLINLYRRVPFPPMMNVGPAAPAYIVTDPAGRQYRLVGSLDESRNVNPGAAPGRAEAAAIDPLDERVRQLVLNYQGSLVRRLWLFARLWLLSYLLGGAGTWTRLIFITLAALYAIFEETQMPRRVAHLIVEPVQRHLEELVMGGPARGGENEGPDRRGAFFSSVWDYLRRAERSLVLFLASLIPGVGERQVAARTAAEAAAARAHREEQEGEDASPPASVPAQSEHPTDAVREQSGGD